MEDLGVYNEYFEFHSNLEYDHTSHEKTNDSNFEETTKLLLQLKEHLSTNEDNLNSFLSDKRFRTLRITIEELHDLLSKRKYSGLSREEMREKKRLESRQHLKQNQKKLKEQDRKKRELAAQRQAKLDCLTALLHPAMIEDGPLRIKENSNQRESQESNQETEFEFQQCCHICKQAYFSQHEFYSCLCQECGALNYAKRLQTADMTGLVCIVTGARIKIGFEITLKLLRSGATVYATTRFPYDCLRRYSILPDFEQFKDRLTIYALDLRNLSHVEQFCCWINSNVSQLHVLIQNAAQTVRRNPAYYMHLMENEIKGTTNNLIVQSSTKQTFSGFILGKDKEFLRNVDDASAIELSQSSAVHVSSLAMIPLTNDDHCFDPQLFPPGLMDLNENQIDLRKTNSWVMKIDEVSTAELCEVHLVNTLAPSIILSKLIPKMRQTKGNKFVVNVGAMEGKFYRYKTANHPHTNMAKAALNMMTRTCAEELAKKDNIFLNSVDTGWITDERPFEKAQHLKKEGFQVPLDEVDAAARVLDPVLMGVKNEKFLYGMFLKDFKETAW